MPTDAQKGILTQAVHRKASADGVSAEAVFADILAMSHTERVAALTDFVNAIKAAAQARKEQLEADSAACAAALADCDAVLSDA